MIRGMPEFKDARMPRYTIKEYCPLLDSSNMGPDDWKQIALDIADNYDRYYGFVVLHVSSVSSVHSLIVIGYIPHSSNFK
jgi:L-asparaginase/Glu-tRNA(Gln) amidotransferase subunit D